VPCRSTRNLDTADYVMRPPRQLIVTWDRAHPTRTGSAVTWERRGVAIWQLDRGDTTSWHRVYTRETPVDKVTGIEGYAVTSVTLRATGGPRC
jgi:hypothetical protein